MLYSLIGEWMYRYGYTIIILGSLALLIAICIYALIKRKLGKSEYKEHLAKRMEEKKASENND